MKKLVLITRRIPSVAYQRLSERFKVRWNKCPLNESQLIQKIKPFSAVLTSLADPVTSKVLNAAPYLQCVANFAVGYNNIDLQAAKASGIWVTNTPDVLTQATADIVWALILSCARRVPEGERVTRTIGFKEWDALFLLGQDLLGKTMGIYGFGRIGKAVAWRARGWNMPILYYQRNRENRRIEKEYNAEYVPFDRLLKESDILSVNSPLTVETKHRFALKEFKKMKSNAIFINASRGLVHREADLVKALKAKMIASAGLDVYEFEPRINPGLLKLNNCTLLPHLGSATLETRNRMALLAAENIELVLTGHLPKTPVRI